MLINNMLGKQINLWIEIVKRIFNMTNQFFFAEILTQPMTMDNGILSPWQN